jgi:hypothetical protein
MITVNDFVTVQSLDGAPLAAQCAAANITYWLMVATDAASARYLESLGVERCFMLPGSEGRAKAEQPYVWHGAPWIGAPWRNTEAVAKVGRLFLWALFPSLSKCNSMLQGWVLAWPVPAVCP